MTTQYEFKEGYLRPTDLEIFDSKHGKGVSLTFVHTLDPLRKAVATIPLADVSHEWPLEIFLRFNSDYPEAAEHTNLMNSFVQRLTDHG